MDTKDKSKRFHGRAFVSVISGFAFLGMAFTGAMLFVTPPGRIAHWTGWTLLGLGKEQWAAQHMWFSLVFFVSALIHVYLNWKPLLSYFKDRVKRTFSFRLEWMLALVLCVVVFFGTLKEVPPFEESRRTFRTGGSSIGPIRNSGFPSASRMVSWVVVAYHHENRLASVQNALIAGSFRSISITVNNL